MVNLLFLERLEVGCQWAKEVSYFGPKPFRAVRVSGICFFLHDPGSNRSARKEGIQC